MSGERQRLVETHATRVIALINDQRRAALEGFLAALQGDPPQVGSCGAEGRGREGLGGPRQPLSFPQPERVLQALQRYLRAEQKEQRHTLRHYQHVAAVEPEKAQQMSFQVPRFFQLSKPCSPSDPSLLDPMPQTFLVPQTLFLSLDLPSCLWNASSVPWDTFQSLGSLLPDPGTLPPTSLRL